jgi:hypothetical protein
MFETLERDLEMERQGREGQRAPGSPQLVLSGEFEPRWGYPRKYHRLEIYRFGSNQEVSWEVTRFQVLDGVP